MIDEDHQLSLFDWAEEQSFNDKLYGFGGFDEDYTNTDITSDITIDTGEDS